MEGRFFREIEKTALIVTAWMVYPGMLMNLLSLLRKHTEKQKRLTAVSRLDMRQNGCENSGLGSEK